MNSTQSMCLTHSQEDRFHKKWSNLGCCEVMMERCFLLLKENWTLRPWGFKWPTEGGQVSQKRQKRLWFLGILRFEKSCSWRSLFNSGPNSKMSPTQSTCLNHGFKDTLIKLVTKMIEWIYWSHEGNAFCFWPTVSHMLSMRYQNPVPQCWKNLEKPLLDTAGLDKRVYGSWELRRPGKATKVIWKESWNPWPLEMVPNLNGPPSVLIDPRIRLPP